jgi:hypothetical protein
MAPGEQIEAIPESIEQGVHRQQAHPSGRQLDRERNSIQREDQLTNLRTVVGPNFERRTDRPSTLNDALQRRALVGHG